MAVFKLTIVRHGETRYNKEKMTQGQGVDLPLTETGVRQANAAGVYLSNVKFTHVFSSDLIRAMQTADLILKNSQFCKEIDVKYDARLRERKYGVAEGKPQSDLKAMAKASGEQCPYFTPPGAETLDEVKARAQDFFEYLCNLIAHEACPEKQTSPRTKEKHTDVAERHSISLTKCDGGVLFHSDSDGAAEDLDANVLVVSHGGYMKSWISYFISDLNCTMPPALTRNEVTSLSPNTGISQFITTLDMKNKPKIYCICLNRDEHLGNIKDENMSN